MIQPVQLPNEYSDPSASYNAIASDYNYYSFIEPAYLRWLNMKVVPILVCQPHFPDQLQDRELCVDDSDRGNLCNVRGGVPLVFESDKKTLIGILDSTAPNEACENGGLSLFIDISRYVGWIKRTIFDSAVDALAKCGTDLLNCEIFYKNLMRILKILFAKKMPKINGSCVMFPILCKRD